MRMPASWLRFFPDPPNTRSQRASGAPRKPAPLRLRWVFSAWYATSASGHSCRGVAPSAGGRRLTHCGRSATARGPQRPRQRKRKENDIDQTSPLDSLSPIQASCSGRAGRPIHRSVPVARLRAEVEAATSREKFSREYINNPISQSGAKTLNEWR
jgi:hypothetical protein